jgi:hypothetical protein
MNTDISPTKTKSVLWITNFKEETEKNQQIQRPGYVVRAIEDN